MRHHLTRPIPPHNLITLWIMTTSITLWWYCYYRYLIGKILDIYWTWGNANVLAAQNDSSIHQRLSVPWELLRVLSRFNISQISHGFINAWLVSELTSTLSSYQQLLAYAWASECVGNDYFFPSNFSLSSYCFISDTPGFCWMNKNFNRSIWPMLTTIMLFLVLFVMICYTMLGISFKCYGYIKPVNFEFIA